MADENTFRQQVFERLKLALGEPETSRVQAGELYRWTLPRPYDVNMYVTMDSPEFKDLAHIMVSDGPRFQSKPLVSFIVYTLEEADDLVERIVKQWELRPPR
ncbi:MAG TPA: hypothetical protein VEB22_12025 [Phycisphaerales bacterium]|nr:hypothetical protein [Phycisphaerales bacterium]